MSKKIINIGESEDIWATKIYERKDYLCGGVSLSDPGVKGWDRAFAEAQFAQAVEKVETKSYNPYEKIAQEVTGVLREVRQEFPAIEKMLMDGQVSQHFDFSKISSIAEEMVTNIQAALEDVQEVVGGDWTSVYETAERRDRNANIGTETEEEHADPMKQGLDVVLGFMNKGQFMLNYLNEELTKDRGNEMISMQDMMKVSAGMATASMTINLAIASTKQAIDTVKGVMNTPL